MSKESSLKQTTVFFSALAQLHLVADSGSLLG